MRSLLDGEDEVVDKVWCSSREEHSWMIVDRPSGYDGGLEMGSLVDDDEGSLGY